MIRDAVHRKEKTRKWITIGQDQKRPLAWQIIAGYFGLYDGLIMEEK